MNYQTPIRAVQASLFASLAGLLLVLSGPAHAGLVAYQSRAIFDAAIAGWTTTSSNFEAEAVGATYAGGTGPAGVGFTLTLSGPSAATNLPAVANQFWTTSASHYLGLDNPDTALQNGDSLTFNFATAVQAFGVYVIGGSDVWPGDMLLSSGASEVFNSGTPDLEDGSGSYAYFLGLVSDDAGTFGSVTISYAPATVAFGVLLPIAMDDVLLAVNDGGTNNIPEPGTLAMLLAGMALLKVGKRQRRNQ